MNNSSMEEFYSLAAAEIHRPGISNLMNWLKNETDFFTSPASAKYHGSHEGGLCEHSVNVCKRLIALTNDASFSPEAIRLVSLFHDVCKVNNYKLDTRNVKNSETNQWEKVPYYTYADNPLPYGHGEKSVYMISKFIQLTDEEAMAINWHMGPFDERAKGGSSTMTAAFEKFPLALYLHQADMQATYLDEKRAEQ
jgi:hypothetical protein